MSHNNNDDTEKQPLLGNLQQDAHSLATVQGTEAAPAAINSQPAQRQRLLRNPIPTTADLDRLRDEERAAATKNEEDRAGLFSALTYSWLGVYIKKALKAELPRGEIMPLTVKDGTAEVTASFWKQFEQELAKESSWARFIPFLWNKETASANESSMQDAGAALPYVPVKRRADGAPGTLLWVGKLLQDESDQSSTRATLFGTSSNMRGAVHWRATMPEQQRQQNYGATYDEHNKQKQSAAAAAAASPGAAPHLPPELVVIDKKVNGEDLLGMLDPRPQDGGSLLITCISVEDIELDFAAAADLPAAPTPTKASVGWALVRSHGGLFMMAIVPRFLAEAAYLLSPYLLELYTAYLHDPNGTWERGAAISAGMAVAYLTLSLMSQKWLHWTVRCGLRIRSALLMSIIFRSLCLSSKGAAHPSASIGRIVTLSGADVNNCNFGGVYMIYILSLPFEALVCMYMLYRLLGWIAFVALGISLAVAPLSAAVLRAMAKKREEMASQTDKRAKLSAELFGAIKTIKAMGLEKNFLASITSVREKELEALRGMQIYRVITNFITTVTPAIMICTALSLFTVTGNALVPETLFPVLSLLGILRGFLMAIPYSLTISMDLNVSLKRLRTFFTVDSLSPYVEYRREMEGAAAAAASGGGQHAMIEAHAMNVLAFESKDAEAELEAGYGAALKRFEEEQDEAAGCCTSLLCGVCGCCNGCCGLSCCGRPRFFTKRGCCTICRSSSTTEKEEEEEEADAEEGNDDGGSGKNQKKKISSKNTQNPKDVQMITAKQVLHDVTLRIPKGKLTFIIGATGAGRSQLLEALLGFSCALKAHDGSGGGSSDDPPVTLLSTTLGGGPSVAYVPQTSWLSNTTIRENITFFDEKSASSSYNNSSISGDGYDKQRLDAAVESCELSADLATLDRGIETRVGSKGVQLSGGQRSRVTLARALYADPDVLVLDDILAALDASTGDKVFKKCILGPQLSSKTRILVTHHVHYAQWANHIIQLDNGRVVFAGDYADYSTMQLQQRESGMVRDASSNPGSASMVDFGSSGGITPATAAPKSTPSKGGAGGAPLFPAVPSSEATAAAEDPLVPRVVQQEEKHAGSNTMMMGSKEGSGSSGGGGGGSGMKRSPGSSGIIAAPLTRRVSSLSKDDLRQRREAASKIDQKEEDEKLKKRPAVTAAATLRGGGGDDDDEAGSAAEEQGATADATTATKSAADGGAEEEEVSQGAVKREVFVNYFRAAGGSSRAIFILLWWALTEVFNQSQFIALTLWASGHATTSSSSSSSNEINHNTTRNSSSSFSSFFAAAFDDNITSNTTSSSSSNGTGGFGLSDNTWLFIYLGCVGSSLISAASRSWILLETGRIASRNIHMQLLSSLLSAKSYFFDVVPLGRILNRFSADVDCLDNSFPGDLQACLTVVFSIIASFAIMSASQPLLLAVLFPAMYVYFRIMKMFNACVLEIKKIDNINKSPLFAAIEETSAGVKTILSFGKAGAVLKQASRKISAYFSSSYCLAIVNRWLGVRLELFGNFFVVTVAVLGVLTKTFESLRIAGDQSMSFIALAITLSMTVSGQCNWAVRMAAQVSSDGNSLDRILKYSNEVDLEEGVIEPEMVPESYRVMFVEEILPERKARQAELDRKNLEVERAARKKELDEAAAAAAAKKNTEISRSCEDKTTSLFSAPATPSTDEKQQEQQSKNKKNNLGASLELINVSMRYRAGLPLAVKNCSFRIAAGEHWAIVGRSGSAKSSLMNVFLRLVDICEDGTMLINGRDARSMPLHELRGYIALVPQTPSLFEGTLRSNLDPFDESTDEAIEQAIIDVGLGDRLLFAALTQEEQRSRDKDSVAAANQAAVAAIAKNAVSDSDDDGDDGSDDGRSSDDEFFTSDAPAVVASEKKEEKSTVKSNALLGRRLPIAEVLSAPISDGASNLSVGQRQQLQLARALIRKQAPIVCLDECSASLSHEADTQIQRVIRQKFRERTTITIAHRLTTIAHCDKILVMDRGSPAEIGSPRQLLKNTQGAFFALVASQGKKAARQFERYVVKFHGPIDAADDE